MKKSITLTTDSDFFCTLIKEIKRCGGVPEDINLLNSINPFSARKDTKRLIYNLAMELAEAGKNLNGVSYEKTILVDYMTPFEDIFCDFKKIVVLDSEDSEIETYFSLTEGHKEKKTLKLIRFNKHINTHKKLIEEIAKQGYKPVSARELMAYLKEGETPTGWYAGKVRIGAIGKLSKTPGGIRAFIYAKYQYSQAILKSRGIGGGFSPDFFWLCEKVK